MYFVMGANKSKILRKQRTKVVEVPSSPLDNESLHRLRPARQPRRNNKPRYKHSVVPETLPAPEPTVQEEPLDLTINKELESYNFDSIGRCSTPSNTYCDHCDHAHGQECCLYVNDTHKDKENYSLFMQFLEKQAYAHSESPLQILPEAIAGNTTPPNFPSFTVNDPKVLQEKMKQAVTPTQPQIMFLPQLAATAAYPFWTPIIPSQIVPQQYNTTPAVMFPTPWHHVHPHYLQIPVYENVPFTLQTIGMPTVYDVERDLMRQNMVYSSMAPPPYS